MAILRAVATIGLLFLVGCSSGPTLNLDQIQQKRVFALTRENAVDATRIFARKEGFIVDSIEDETGRFVGHRVVATRGRESRTIIMNLRITAVDSGHTEVLTRFTFAQMSQTATREEEGMLIDCYYSLYQILESAAN